MRINKTKNTQKNKFLVIGIVIAIVLLGIGTAYAIKLNTDSKNAANKPGGVNYSPPTDEQIKNGTTIKQDSVDNTNNTDTPSSPTPQPGSSQSKVEISMTRYNQDPSQFQIYFQIDADTTEGTCNLTLSKADKTLTYSSGVQANNKIATCKGFTIPIDVNNLTPGTWQVVMSFSNTTLTGSLNTSINVN